MVTYLVGGLGHGIESSFAAVCYGEEMLKTTVYLDNDVALAIRQLANSEGRSQAEIIREALALYTRQAVPAKPKRIGAFRSGRSDVSERSRELIREAVKEGRWP